jgi:hypothetical protein
MQTNAQGAIEIHIGDPQVGDFLNPRPGVIEDHEDSPIAERKGPLARQVLEQSLDFVALQIISLRRRSAFRRNRLHTLSVGQHLRILEADIPVESMQSGEPLIACAHVISARDLDHVEEVEHSLCG